MKFYSCYKCLASFIVCCVIMSNIELVAQPSLTQVYPYIGLNKMDIKWTAVAGAEEYEIYRKENNGMPASLKKVPATETNYKDENLSATSTYTYQLRVKVAGQWSNLSNEKSNSFKRIWPVRLPSDTITESIKLLHGFGQPIEAGGNKYFHEGVDINGEPNIDNELVVAPVGGILKAAGQEIPGDIKSFRVDLQVSINNTTRFIRFNHLKDIPPNLLTAVMGVTSIAAGDTLGKILDPTSDAFVKTLSSHTHCHYWTTYIDIFGTAINPLNIWDNPQYTDPQGNVPQVMDTNGDGKPLQFRKAHNSAEYITDEKIYNGVDIIVEAVDKQSSDIPFQIPKVVGYYIQRLENSTWIDAVKSPVLPYILVDNENYYYSNGYSPNSDIVGTIIDTNIALKSKKQSPTPNDYIWEQWFTYIVTNTIGTTGYILDLDSNQYWATDARNTVTEDNGYKPSYEKARAIDEAKFPDGKYRVNIRLEDFVNKTPDYQKEILVDNFRPYAKKVEIQSGKLNYVASWNWDMEEGKLTFKPDVSTEEACGIITIIVTTSEPMKDVSIEIPTLKFSVSSNTPVANTNAMEWKFEIPAAQTKDADEGPHKIFIDGHDLADNSLQGFTIKEDVYGKKIYSRALDGTWYPTIPPPERDEVHEFRIMDLTNGKISITSNISSKCGSSNHLATISIIDPLLDVKNFEYALNDGAFQSSNQFNDLSEGDYTAKVRSKEGGCEFSMDFAIRCEKPDDAKIIIIRPNDPNDIVGPSGFTNQKWVSKNDVLPYTIHFENDPEFATAPAQVVKITQSLDNNVDIKSFRLSDFGFGQYIFKVPTSSTYYTNRLNLVDSLGVLVDVTAGLDVTKREVFWILESIDPQTGLAPADANAGFLPVNDTSTHIGEGFVSYTIKPSPSSVTGDIIYAKANIIFDINEVIPTPEIFNTIDALPPVSKITKLQPVQSIADSSGFLIHWSANDDPGGCGVKDYQLYYSEENSPFVLHNASPITDTFTVFQGTAGKKYAFKLSARDNVNNAEAIKDTAETETVLLPSTGIVITSPTKKDTFCNGSTIDIRWTSNNVNKINILYSPYSDSSYKVLASEVPATDSNFIWATPGSLAASTQYRIKLISSTDSTQQSFSENFTILEPFTVVITADSNLLQATTGKSYQWHFNGNLIPGATQQTYLAVNTGKYSVRVTNTDGCTGLSPEYIFGDINPITIKCPSDKTVSADSTKCSSVVKSIDPVITPSGKSVNYSFSGATTGTGSGSVSGKTFNKGITTVTYTSADEPAKTCVFAVTVNDDELPVAHFKNATVVLDQNGKGTLNASEVNDNSTDNCGIDTMTVNPNAFTTADIGVKQVTLTVTDESGNSITITGNVTVECYQKIAFYRDADGDGYGNAGSTTQACAAPSGYVNNSTDCDDSKSSVHPGITEICNGIDDNCDGQIDEGFSLNTYYQDADGDAYGNLSVTTTAKCTAPSGYVINSTDCNDANAAVHPGATEICDGMDNNCDGRVDEGCLPVTISIADVSMKEGNKGKSTMMFAVTLNKAFNKKVTVQYATQNGTATAGSDYAAKSGTITFTAGSTKQSISISVMGDKTVEPDETFKVNLSNAVNASIAKATGTGTIQNDDGTTAISSTSFQTNNETSIHSIKISPNPVAKILRVELFSYTGNVTMQFMNLQGKMLKQEKIQTGILKYAQQQINVTGIPSGTYFLVVIDEKGNRQTERVIIAR